MFRRLYRLRHRLRLCTKSNCFRELFLFLVFLGLCKLLLLLFIGTKSNASLDSVEEQGERKYKDGVQRAFVSLRVQSSPYSVFVDVDGTRVYNKDQDSRNARGIHVIVLNQSTGKLMASNVFDTRVAGEDVLMMEFLKKLKKERLIIFAVMDDGSSGLGDKAKSYLEEYGSEYIKYLNFRDTWLFVSMNQQLVAEDYEQPNEEGWPQPIVMETEVQLEMVDTSVCEKWRAVASNEDLVERRRRRFCELYEGFDKVCDCESPKNINLSAPPLAGGGVVGDEGIASKLPISVVAGNRPFYLFRMLRGLLTTPGVNKQMVTVYIDGYPTIVKDVVTLFDVKYVNHVPGCQYSCRISEHVRQTMKDTFEKYPSVDYMIILEEDLDVSKDIMDYFSQLIPVLASDESVYCVSAWNDQGYTHAVNDSSLLYRVETMPGLGWVLKRNIFEELLPKWPPTSQQYDWDNWMREPQNIKGRECIIPDISRTYHFGSKGVHINPRFQTTYFESHALNNETGIRFQTNKITKDGYEVEMNGLIQNAQVLNSKDPCSHDLIPKDNRGHSYVLYIKQNDTHDYSTWSYLAGCFGIWDIDGRGVHKQMWAFWKNGNRVFIVGSHSPYYKYKTKDVKPFKRPPPKNNSDINDENDKFDRLFNND